MVSNLSKVDALCDGKCPNSISRAGHYVYRLFCTLCFL